MSRARGTLRDGLRKVGAGLADPEQGHQRLAVAERRPRGQHLNDGGGQRPGVSGAPTCEVQTNNIQTTNRDGATNV